MCDESVVERRESDQKHREIGKRGERNRLGKQEGERQKLLLEWHEQSRVLVHREI